MLSTIVFAHRGNMPLRKFMVPLGSLDYGFIISIILESFIPNGTIAQLGERATEVRKVAGSIPARPIMFLVFLRPQR
ncbi:hypothetical protein N7517_007576, partial [Penicillium concentricum]